MNAYDRMAEIGMLSGVAIGGAGAGLLYGVAVTQTSVSCWLGGTCCLVMCVAMIVAKAMR